MYQFVMRSRGREVTLVRDPTLNSAILESEIACLQYCGDNTVVASTFSFALIECVLAKVIKISTNLPSYGLSVEMCRSISNRKSKIFPHNMVPLGQGSA
jgi:hypothetical protein